MKNVNYKNLRRFDLGTIKTSPGYQANKNIINTGMFDAQSGYDMSNDVQTVKQSLVPSAISGLGNLGQTALNVAKNYTTQKMAEETGKRAGMNAAGSVASIAGALYGTGMMIKDFTDFSNRLGGGDFQQMSSQSTQSKNGVNYKTYDGFNEQQVKEYTDAQNKAGTLSSTLNGMSAGASAGSLGGWIGTAIGAVAGGLTGLIGSWIGGNRRKKKVEEEMNRTLAVQAGYNTQAESEAGSQGLRNQFYENHADKGKSPGQRFSGGKLGIIQTPSGPAYGEVQGLASPDEGQIDMTTGETNYNGSKNMNVKDRRADIVPVGITGYANGGAFDNNVGIPGHMTDVNGLSFADNARPLFKQNEQLKDAARAIDIQLELNDSHKTRNQATKRYMENRLNQKMSQIQQQYQQNAQGIADIVNRQTAMTNGGYYSCGKTPKYVDGKSLWQSSDLGLAPAFSFLSGLPYAISENIEANRQKPFAQNSFVSNTTAPAALSTLASLGYDTTRQDKMLTSAGKQNIYNIESAGSLSAGQREMLKQAGLINLAQARGQLEDKAIQARNGYKTAYADMLMKYGQDDAARHQQANAIQQENLAKAYGAKQKLQAQARKNWFTLTRQGVQDINTMLNSRAMYDLWNKDIALKEAALKNGAQQNGTQTPAAQTYSMSNITPAKGVSLVPQINPVLNSHLDIPSLFTNYYRRPTPKWKYRPGSDEEQEYINYD